MILLLSVCIQLVSGAKRVVHWDEPNKEFPNLPMVDVVDYSDLEGLPKLEHGGRVTDLYNGEHFVEIIRDTPLEMRPPSLVMFHGFETCPEYEGKMDYTYQAENTLPARERLLISKYDFDRAPRLNWYKFTPERDLMKRFNINACELVWVQHCDHMTWCEEPHKEGAQFTKVGCENFEEPCSGIDVWDGEGSWVSWVEKKLEASGWPKLNSIFESYNFQGRFIQERSDITTNTFFRNSFMSMEVPAFTKTGVKVVETPPELQEYLVDFYKKNQARIGHYEKMHFSETQNSHPETAARIISVSQRGDLATKYLRPLVAEWTGIPEKYLTMTSFYGIREYATGHFLRGHIDRLDTHVLSLTLSVAKLDKAGEILPQHYDRVQNRTQWPLEWIDYEGNNMRYEHPPGTTILYESAKVVHGRPMRQPEDAGLHLGAFCHFAPSSDILDWDTTVSKARKNTWKYAQRVTYKQTESVEPPNPVLTSRPYAEIGIDDISKTAVSNEFWVNFHNSSPYKMSLYWISEQGEPVENCRNVSPKSKCNIGTYPGHKFGWGRTVNGQTKIIKDSEIKITSGKKDYYYASKVPFEQARFVIFD